jgi:hypothetical protein
MTNMWKADGSGRFNHFQGGSIYWAPTTGAHVVHGAIREKWAALGWELSALGYPTEGTRHTADGVGLVSLFEHGSIHWHPRTGAHGIYGAIYEKAVAAAGKMPCKLPIRCTQMSLTGFSASMHNALGLTGGIRRTRCARRLLRPHWRMGQG